MNLILSEIVMHITNGVADESTIIGLTQKEIHQKIENLYAEGVKYINIGGGSRFNLRNCLNIDSVPSESFPVAFHLSEMIKFPLTKHSIELAYSSHVFEHLTDTVVEKVLSESLRVLDPKNGKLLIQIPDFDLGLKLWREGKTALVDALLVDDITPTWRNRDIPISTNNKCATLFCAFWNSTYGNHYNGRRNKDFPSYFGPPRISNQTYERLLLLSPHEIAAYLTSKVHEQEDFESFNFNHRNAWSNAEFVALMNKNGFEIETTDKKALAEKYAWIPEISRRIDWSAFYLAVPSS